MFRFICCCRVEPGYYDAPHEFGIRIENVYIVRSTDTEYGTNGTTFLQFDPVTLVPIQMTLVEPRLLSFEEVECEHVIVFSYFNNSLQITWLNMYHLQCATTIGAELERQGLKDVHKWLLSQCKPIDVSLAGGTR
jgi:Xaa-Pro aminopeptidase